MHTGPHTPRPSGDPRRRRQRARRRLLLVVMLVIVIVAIAVAVLVARAGGNGGKDTAGSPVTSAAAGTKPGEATPSPTPTQPPPAVWVATRADPVRVWAGGDSLGGELGYGLSPLLEKAKVFRTVLYYKESSGICRWDFFDWGRKMTSIMRSARPNAVAIMMGTNDTQSIWDNGVWTAYGKPAWKTKYEARVGDMMQTMLDGGARRVYWVGMPIMGESWRNSRMKLINSMIARAAAAHPGARYIDVWPLFANADGTYDAGWRAGDGVHFTVAGQQRLAKTVFAAIKKDWAPYGLPSAKPTPAASPSASVSASASP
jgi:uncharacterized protein